VLVTTIVTSHADEGKVHFAPNPDRRQTPVPSSFPLDFWRLETMQSLQALDQSRRQYLRVVAGYNEAQFRLQRAVGWEIRDIL
jgi:hypothetical protein